MGIKKLSTKAVDRQSWIAFYFVLRSEAPETGTRPALCYQLTDLGIVGRLYAELLVHVKPDVPAAFDHDRADTESGAYAGTDGCADRTARYSADGCAGSCGHADLGRVGLDAAFTLRGPFL